jgi:DNA-binding phage protein
LSDQSNPFWGSTLEDFLKEEGIYEAARTTAILRVVAWQLAQEMARQGLSKTELAARMHTSRAQLDRVLKADGNVTLETLQRAAALVGHELHVELQ